MKPIRFGTGISAYPKTGSFDSARKTTSGPWGIPDPADRVPKSITIEAKRSAVIDRTAKWGVNAIGILRFGIWCSCSLIETQTVI